MSPEIRFDLEDRALLIRYYAGVSDAAERTRAEAIIAQVPDERLFARAFENQVVCGTPEPTSGEISAAIAAWRNQDAKAVKVGLSTRSRWRGEGRFKEGTLRRWVWGGAALAAVAIIALRSGGLVPHGGHRDVAVSAYTTGNGERATISLPDGNTVSLNVASRLEVPVDYSAGDHTLRLTGEALFTVVHHNQTPFTVMAGVATTRVLGTSFVVRHYPTDSATLVAVRDGKVSIHSIVLAANRQVLVARNGVSQVQISDPATFRFVTGVLTLDSLLLSDAIPDLNRWYDADIRLGDPVLAKQRLTGDLPTGTLADLQNMLAMSLNVRVVRKGRVLTLFPK